MSVACRPPDDWGGRWLASLPAESLLIYFSLACLPTRRRCSVSVPLSARYFAVRRVVTDRSEQKKCRDVSALQWRDLQALPHLVERQSDIWPVIPLVRQIHRHRAATLQRREHAFRHPRLAERPNDRTSGDRPHVDAGTERQHHEQDDVEWPPLLVSRGERGDFDF